MTYIATAADYGFTPIPQTAVIVPDFAAAIDALRTTRPTSVAFVISTQHTNFLPVRCATAVAADMREAGFGRAADAIDRAIAYCDFLGAKVVIQRGEERTR